MKGKILINVPNLELAGGVAEIYRILNLDFLGKSKYFYIYFDSNSRNFFKRNTIFRIIRKYYEFFRTIDDFELIVINPSLTINSLLRDMLFCIIARIKNKKYIIFWHGWEDSIELKIKNLFILNFIFKKTFGSSQGIIVLGQIFKQKLLNLKFNYNSDFLIFNNCVSNTNPTSKSVEFLDLESSEINLLFISRIEKGKGMEEAIEVFKLLKRCLPGKKIKLTIAGDGKELKYLKENVHEKGVEFPGYIKGKDKNDYLKKAHIFLFPTSYPEGLPLVILEAMSYGLPIITSPIGGIPDVIKSEVNGYLVEPKNIDLIKDLIIKLIFDKELYLKISKNNMIFSKKTLTPEKARNIYLNFLNQLIEE